MILVWKGVIDVNKTGIVLDKETKEMEDKAFNDWLEKASKKNNKKTAKSFNDVIAERR